MPIPKSAGLKAPVLNPVAAPVDRYAPPGDPQRVTELARALGGFAPELQKLGGVLAPAINQKHLEEGENAATAAIQDGKTWKDAVDKGLVKPTDNPWFQLGAQNTFGKVLGGRYVEDMTKALAQSPVAHSTKTEDFDTFEADFRKQWSADKLGDAADSHLVNAFNDTVNTGVLRAREQYSSAAASRLFDDNKDAISAEAGQLAKQALQTGDFASLAAQYDTLIARQRATSGLSYSELNRIVAESVIASAREARSLDLLDKTKGVLAQLKTKGGKVGDIADISEAVIKARHEISEEIQQAHVQETKQQMVAARSQSATIHADFVDAMLDAQAKGQPLSGIAIAPYVKRIEDNAAVLAALGEDTNVSERLQTLTSARNALLASDITEDDAAKRRLNIGIDNGSVGMYQIVKALGDKRINNETYRQFSTLIKERDANGGVGKFFNDEGYKEVTKELDVVFAGGLKEGLNLAYSGARDYVRDQYIKWRRTPQGTQPTPEILGKWISETVERAKLEFIPESRKVIGNVLNPKPTVDLSDPPALVDMSKYQTHVGMDAYAREWEGVTAGTRKALSDQAIQVLLDNHIKLTDPDAITKFFAQQAKLSQPNK